MNELVLLAKYWEPGRVKTRLAARLGDRAASELYRAFVVALVQRLEGFGDRRTIFYSPGSAASHFRTLVGERPWQLRRQSGGDLGHRLAHVVEQSLQDGTRRIVILGTDSPSVPLSHVRQAFDALERSDVALGPTEDGGYYLIGLRRSLPELFRGIEWSSCRVWQQTLDRLLSMSCSPSFEILPRWYDIDNREDLDRLINELASTTAMDAALSALDGYLRRLLGR